MELCDPLFALSTSFGEMQVAYRKFLRKDDAVKQEHKRRHVKGETWCKYYMELVRLNNRRGNYCCW